ncbi:hypothetical protein Tco_0397381 [Tanacetum coccineum]
MATKPKLDADLSGEPVDQTDYLSKIGLLMYLTSSRPDIVQDVHPSDTYELTMKMENLFEPASNKLLVDGDGDASFQLDSDSLPHAHAQTTKTYYKHQDSRIMKAQELKTKTFAQTLIYKISFKISYLSREIVLASFKMMQRVDITAKTRRPQPRSNTKNDRVPSASKSSCIKNKEVKVEEHHRNLLLSKNKEHISSECNNVKLAIQNDKSEVICAM